MCFTATDLITGALLLSIGGGVALWVARKLQLSRLPVSVVGPLLLIFGLLVHVPSSPLYLISDGEYYLGLGADIANTWRGGEVTYTRHPWPNKEAWPIFLASLVWLMGPVIVTPIVINLIILLGTILIMQIVARNLGASSSGWTLTLLLATCLPFLVFGPSTLREAIFWLGSSLGILSVSFFFSGRILRGFSTLAGASIVLLVIRPDLGVILIYSFGFLLIVFGVLTSKPFRWRRITASVVALAALALSAPSALQFVRPSISPNTVIVVSEALGAQDVTSAFSGALPADSTWALSESRFCSQNLLVISLCSAGKNLIPAFFGPFWVDIRGEPVLVAAALSTAHFHFLGLLSLLFFFQRNTKKRAAMVLAGLAIVTLVIFAAILTNYGVLMRFRTVTALFLIPLAVAAASRLEKSMRRRLRF